MNKRKEKNKNINDIKKNAETKTDESVDEQSEQNLNEEVENNNNDTESPNLEKSEAVEKDFREEIEQMRDEKLRLLAEMENLRKRFDKDRIDSIKYGSINLARDILSPADNLSRALDVIPEDEKNTETVKNLIDGLKMVQKEFSTILEKHGVKKIQALNSKFDHNFHQAMVEIENDEVNEGTVIEEMQKGYTMHDRLLRPSMVGVSRKGQKNKSEKKD